MVPPTARPSRVPPSDPSDPGTPRPVHRPADPARWRMKLLVTCVAITAGSSLAGCTGCEDVDDDYVRPDAGQLIDYPERPDGNGECDFAELVTDLIEHQTTATSRPSTDIGERCADRKDPAQFAQLFR